MVANTHTARISVLKGCEEDSEESLSAVEFIANSMLNFVVDRRNQKADNAGPSTS